MNDLGVQDTSRDRDEALVVSFRLDTATFAQMAAEELARQHVEFLVPDDLRLR